MSKKNEYNEMLRSPLWQKRRLEILDRDNWTCRLCGSTEKELHVHHICYKRGLKPWEYKDYQLITLCSECHEAEHDMYGWILSEIDGLREKGYLLSEIYELLVNTDFRLTTNPFRIKEICEFIKPNGQYDKFTKVLESLAERRMLLKADDNDLY